jgi:hypothetical protein
MNFRINWTQWKQTLLHFWQGFKHGSLWGLYSPSIAAFVLFFGLIIAIWQETIPYLSDIIDPGTLAELGGIQTVIYLNGTKELALLAAFLLLIFGRRGWKIFALVLAGVMLATPWGNEIHRVPLLWLLLLIMLVCIWGFLFNIVRLLNISAANARKQELGIRTEDLPAEKFNPLNDTRRGTLCLPAKEQVTGSLEKLTLDIAQSKPAQRLRMVLNRWPLYYRRSLDRRFLALFLVVWIATSLPAWLCIPFFVLGKVDQSWMAWIGTCSLIGLFSLSLALALLGGLANVYWWLRLPLTLSPFLVFLVFLFSLNPLENGQGILNKPHRFLNRSGRTPADEAADQTLQTALPERGWLKFLAVNDSDHSAAGVRDPNHQGPLVLICCAGGGSRAAIFTAGIFCRMWEQEVTADAVTPLSSIATDYPNKTWGEMLGAEPFTSANSNSSTLFPGRLLLQRADVISSVSGGTLASAYLTEGIYRFLPHAPAPPKETNAERQTRMAGERYQALERFFAQDNATARPPVRWYSKPAPPAQRLREAFSSSNAFPDSTGMEVNLRRLETFDTNHFINAMRQNWVAAPLVGFFWPFTAGRGATYENVWGKRFEWYDDKEQTQPRRLSHFFEDEASGRLPVLISNSMLTGTGARMAITNLDKDEFQPLEKFGAAVSPIGLPLSGRRDGRYDPQPGQIVTLNRIAPEWNIRLQTAVHASSNFPFALPPMRIEQTASDKSGDQQMIWKLLDGGGINNYGTDTVLALVRKYKSQIQQRGVLIFQIDGSFMTKDARRAGGLLSNLGETSTGWWRGSQNAGAALNSLYLRELAYLLGEIDKLQPLQGKDKRIIGYHGKNFAYFLVRAGENKNEQVLTYWHLNELERNKLYSTLLAPQQGEAILCAAEWLERHRLKTSERQ